jgi:putative DNA primase/helicase
LAAPPEEAPTDENKAKATTADEQKLIDELARLNAVDYDRRRNEAADQMGIRRGTLDNQVNARRSEQAEETGPPPLFGHWVVEPWPEAVDTGELIAALVARIKRHVIFSDDEALTVVLWILFAWVHDAAAVHSPILLATSAEANSGKTQLLSLIGFLVPRALVCVEISEATLFRGIEKWLPTLLVDEADVILIKNEPLRAVVNSGWTRGSCVPRCIGDDNTPHAFPTFCPKVIGMKGRKLPDATLTRSIIIEMKRKKTGETVTHFRSIDDAGLAELRRRALRWAIDNGEKLDGAEPVMPPGFDNRLGDNWSLLLAIADYAGAELPAKARKAAASLSKVAEVASTGTRLLADIKAAFDEAGVDRISSAELVATLSANTESPWAEWKGGKPITQAQLARVLKPFSIGSEVVRLAEHSTPRGYMRSQFEDAWERYL